MLKRFFEKAINNNIGFSLVEALAAMAIFSVVMMATGAMLFSSMVSSRTSNDRYIGTAQAQAVMEQLMSRDITFTSIGSNIPNTIVNTYTDPVKGIVYTTRWSTVNVPLATPVTKYITVYTEWPDPAAPAAAGIAGSATVPTVPAGLPGVKRIVLNGVRYNNP